MRLIKCNHLSGHTSRYSFEYDFAGNTLTSHESHQVGSSTTHAVLKRNTYDHRDRLLSTTTTLNGGTPAIVSYTYDELGQLKTRKLGNVATSTSQYNIQGWLTSQESPEFSLSLSYDLRGNIDHMCAFNPGLIGQCHHIFEYDLFGRLLSGYSSMGRFGEEIAGYDLNGNIQGLRRVSNGYESADWQYSYIGNRLTGLSGVAGSYTYDPNGNILTDPRKNLSFTHNSLNLLDEVKTGSTLKARYLYSYDGVKKRVQDAAGSNGYDYLGGLTLVKTAGTQTPEYHFGEGIIRGTQVMYFEKDHLGSVRTVLNSSGTVLERNDYYPFGTRHETAEYSMTANNRFKFNGKEDQTVGTLGLLDYGARMYDAQIGRWLAVDPMADSYYPISPYVYCYNNPIIHIDPDGESPVKIAKAVYNVGKRAYKVHKSSGKINFGKVLKEEGLSIWDNVTTIFDGDASTFDKVIAGVDLVTGFGGEIKQGAKALGIADNAQDVKKVHGNSKLSTKAQHNYDIIDTETGKVVKTGTSGGKITKSGESYRAKSQANKWNKESKDGNKERYKTVITNEVSEGEGAREAALEYERKRAELLRKLGELDDPMKHQIP